MTTKDIRASSADAHVTCDVCGRTLLRGERARPYLDGSAQRSVCELCTTRAHQEGWIPEGMLPAYDGGESGSDRRRSLLGRWRRRREAVAPEVGAAVSDDLGSHAARPAPERAPARLREPRHVRAVPSSSEQRIASAITAFNACEHRRTVAGVARSLGLPTVSVRPVTDRPSIVSLVVAWELCWYRYEVDLADESARVRVAAQGSELDELEPAERSPNAVCDEQGSLTIG